MCNIFKCCGKTGKPGVRCIGYIDIVVAIVLTGAWILACGLSPGSFLPYDSAGDPKHATTPNIVAIIIGVAFFFLEACLLNIILSAIKSKSVALCDNWIKIRLILLCVFVFGLLYWMTLTNDAMLLYVGGGSGLFYIFYRVYSLLVVRNFQNEISPNDIKIPIEIPLQTISIKSPKAY